MNQGPLHFGATTRRASCTSSEVEDQAKTLLTQSGP